jgi:hypothetical protein
MKTSLISLVALTTVGGASKQQSVDAAVAAALAAQKAGVPAAPIGSSATANTDPMAWTLNTYAGRDKSKEVCAKAGPIKVVAGGDASNNIVEARDVAVAELARSLEVKTKRAAQRAVKVVKGIAGQDQNITNVDDITRTYVNETMNGVEEAGTIMARQKSNGEWVMDQFAPEAVYARACITVESNQAVQKIAQAMGITNAVVQQANEIRDDQMPLYDAMVKDFEEDSSAE